MNEDATAGPKKGSCSGTTRHGARAGLPCALPPRPGASVCHKHGGRAKHIRDAADVRTTEQHIGRLLAEHMARDVTNPLAALLEITAEVVRWKDFLAARLATLTTMRFTDERGTEQLRSEIVLYERALDRCGRFLLDVAKLNIEERLLRMQEREAALIGEVLRGVLTDLGLSSRTPEVAQHLNRRLRALPGGQAAS